MGRIASLNVLPTTCAGPRSAVGRVLTRKSGVLGSIPGLATYFRFTLPLIQEGQLSVTGESM